MDPVDTRASVLEIKGHPLPYYSLVLSASADLALAQPGQFVMVQCTTGLEPYLRRPFSIYDVSKQDHGARIELLAKVVGRGTGLLAQCRAGDEVPMLGPLGRPYRLPTRGPVALVAGSVGSAALLLLAKELVECQVPFDFFYGGRSQIDLPCRDVFARCARSSGGELVATTEDGTLGELGVVTAPLERALAAHKYASLYACGPMGLLARLAQLAHRYGIPGQAALETPMGCGFGACLGCAVPHPGGHYSLCCKDGPVFSFDEVAW